MLVYQDRLSGNISLPIFVCWVHVFSKKLSIARDISSYMWILIFFEVSNERMIDDVNYIMSLFLVTHLFLKTIEQKEISTPSILTFLFWIIYWKFWLMTWICLCLCVFLPCLFLWRILFTIIISQMTVAACF